MITYLQSAIVGITQGLTEFLPVSSSAHIVLTSILYKYLTGKQFLTTSEEEIFFDIIIHLGTLLAVFIYFRKEFFNIITKVIQAIIKRNFSDSDAKLGLFIFVGTFFTVLIAFPCKDMVQVLMTQPYICGLFLIGTGIILFLSEYLTRKNRQSSKSLTFKESILIGISQGFAIFPGFSRSGLTIAMGLFLGLNRENSAKFSFLLSAPIILGSSIFYPILELDFSHIVKFNWSAIFLGFIISAIVGYLCIKYFLKFIAKYSLNIFAVYCVIIGLITFFTFAFFLK